MNNSIKNGIISGSIAGLVLTIVLEIYVRISVSIGLWDTFLREIITPYFFLKIFPLFIFWGAILGIIYSKVYSLIPKEKVMKGLIYGLLLFFIISLRYVMYDYPNTHTLSIAGFIFIDFFAWLAYGLALGIVYESLGKKYFFEKESEISQYPIKSSLMPGAIAGLSSGIIASVFYLIFNMPEVWNLIIIQILINILWGIIFGGIFNKVYNIVPRKKKKKGLYYGLIMFFITIFNVSSWTICLFAYNKYWQFIPGVIGFYWISGFAQAIIFGLVLGYLYKK
jgi:hypothetical protein